MTDGPPIPVKRRYLKAFLPPSYEDFAQAVQYAESEARHVHWKSDEALAIWLIDTIRKQLRSATEIEVSGNDLESGQPILRIMLTRVGHETHVRIRDTSIGENKPQIDPISAGAIARSVERMATSQLPKRTDLKAPIASKTAGVQSKPLVPASTKQPETIKGKSSIMSPKAKPR